MEVFHTLAAAGGEFWAMQCAAVNQISGALEGLKFEWLSPTQIPESLRGRPPTFLLHGSHGDPSNWIDFLRAIDRAKPAELGPVYLLKFTDAEDSLLKLTQMVDEVMTQTDGPIYLVGHSLGGVVAAQYAALHPGRVEKLCLIGSRLQVMGDVWQDGPAFLYEDLTAAIGRLGRTWQVDAAPHEIYTFTASHDWLVPKGAVTLPNAHPTVIPGASHLSMIQSEELHRELLQDLWNVVDVIPGAA